MSAHQEYRCGSREERAFRPRSWRARPHRGSLSLQSKAGNTCQPIARPSMVQRLLLTLRVSLVLSEVVGWWPSENFGVVRNPNPAVCTARLADPSVFLRWEETPQKRGQVGACTSLHARLDVAYTRARKTEIRLSDGPAAENRKVCFPHWSASPAMEYCAHLKTPAMGHGVRASACDAHDVVRARARMMIRPTLLAL